MFVQSCRTQVVSRPLAVWASAAAALFFTSQLVLAQPPGTNPNEFIQIGGYVLLENGKAVEDVSFYRSAAAGTVLIDAEVFGGIAELVPRERKVKVLPEDTFAAGKPGQLMRQSAGEPTSSSALQIVDQLPKFDVAGKSYAMKLKDPLLGPQTAEDIVAWDPTWGVRADLYEPYAQYLNPLFEVDQPVLVKVFFGSWCNHCQDMVPKIFKLQQQLVNTNINFEYYGVPQDIQSDDLAKQFDIQGQLPFGVIYVDGEERQRVQGLSWRFPDMAIFRAVSIR